MSTEQSGVEISIIVLTYYHERFIAQALDSILAQKTNLRFEILIGDDASQDRTQEIISEYARQYPDIIHPVLRSRNLGTTKNAYDIKTRARGRYLASLEGDDYWLDQYKLQRQWDFLEMHPEYIGCGGKCLVVDEDGNPDYTRTPRFARNKKVFTLEDLIRYWDMPFQEGTMMCRNIFREMAPEDYAISYQAHRLVGDKTMMLLLLSQGPVYCENRVLSCYRFVIKKGGHNWFSIHHANPYWQYDGFMYPCRLEKWARKNLGIQKHLGDRKDYHFCSFVEDLIRKPSLTRLRYLAEMIASSHQPLKYSLYILKALIEME